MLRAGFARASPGAESGPLGRSLGCWKPLCGPRRQGPCCCFSSRARPLLWEAADGMRLVFSMPPSVPVKMQPMRSQEAAPQPSPSEMPAVCVRPKYGAHPHPPAGLRRGGFTTRRLCGNHALFCFVFWVIFFCFLFSTWQALLFFVLALVSRGALFLEQAAP